VAVALARVEDGETGDRFIPTVLYANSGFVEWLTVEMRGRELTLRALADGLDPGVYRASVSVTGESTGGQASLRVEFSVVK
jgi:hypothetical protein